MGRRRRPKRRRPRPRPPSTPRRNRRRRSESGSTTSSTARCSRWPRCAALTRSREGRLRHVAGGPTASEEELGLTTALPAAVDGWSVALDENGVLRRTRRRYAARPCPGRLHADAVPDGQAGRDRRQALHAKELRGRDARHPRRVTARVRDGGEPDSCHRTANTFEANFQYEVVDPAGKVVDTHFVTATSGTGTRGTFDFTTKRYKGEAGQGALVVLELSAKDGSRINEVRIPLQLEP